MEFVYVILILIAFSVVLLGLSFLLQLCVHSIKSPSIKKFVKMLFWVFFLPLMLAWWSVGETTEAERKAWYIPLSVRARTTLVLLSLALYGIGYYFLFTWIF